LSLQARLSIALRLFAGYCDRRGLAHPEVAAYINSLWGFIRLPGSTEAFVAWESSQPPLVDAGLGYEYPPGFEAFLESRGVPEREFRHALCCTTEILYGSMYAAADEPGSRRFLSELVEVVIPYGVVFPDTRPFAGSRWSERSGWGARPGPEELAAWRGEPDA
jgi:hypothetical protein